MDVSLFIQQIEQQMDSKGSQDSLKLSVDSESMLSPKASYSAVKVHRPKAQSYYLGSVIKPNTDTEAGLVCFWYSAEKGSRNFDVCEGFFVPEDFDAHKDCTLKLGDFVSFLIDYKELRTATNKWRFTLRKVSLIKIEYGRAVKDGNGQICVEDAKGEMHQVPDAALYYPDWKLSATHKTLYSKRHVSVPRRYVEPQEGERVKYALSAENTMLFAAVAAVGKVTHSQI